MHCPACAAEIPDEDLFCEECGQSLTASAEGGARAPAEDDCVCGAPASETDEDGFCLRCGRKSKAATAERAAADHIELAISADFAAVTDRGLRHDHNEDRFGIATAHSGYALVVCDGVSTTRESEVASSAVVEGVLERLAAALEHSTEVGFDAAAELRSAIAAGAERLRSRTSVADRDNPPSTTAVAALVIGSVATIAWVGDSRAYWVDEVGAKALTVDHSWLNEVVAAGELTVEEAEKSPRAHAITRWLGSDIGARVASDGDAETGPSPESTPEVVSFALPLRGLLMLCTDGLWNYADEPDVMHGVVGAAGAAHGDEALEIARRLVGFANEQGGRDNITVALLRVGVEAVETEHAEAAAHTA